MTRASEAQESRWLIEIFYLQSTSISLCGAHWQVHVVSHSKTGKKQRLTRLVKEVITSST